MSLEEYWKCLPKIKIPKKMFIGDGSVMVLEENDCKYATSTVNVVSHLQLLRDTLEYTGSYKFLCNINASQLSIFGKRVSSVDTERITAHLLCGNISVKALFRTLKHLGAPEAKTELPFVEEIDYHFDEIGLDGFVGVVRNYLQNKNPDIAWSKTTLLSYSELPDGQLSMDLRKHFVDDICASIQSFDTTIQYMKHNT